MSEQPIFLLVHGSWHGPWCFELLEAELARRGAVAKSVSLPSVGCDTERLGTFGDDARVVTAAAASMPGPVVVVGHSYGGAVVSEATFGPNVKRLVFLGAFMPDTGRGYVSYLPPGPLPPYVELREDGTFAVPHEQATPFFYADCPPDIAAAATMRLCPQSQQVMAETITDAAWRSHPSTYVVLTDDRVLPPDLQRMFAAQAGEIRELESSHSPFLSKPAELAELLIVCGGN